MKTRLLTLSLVAALAACNRAPTNNITANEAAGPLFGGNNSSGSLPLPPERSEGSQQTAMPAGLACVRNRLSPEERRAVAQAAMEQAPRGDPRAEALLRAVDACGDELSWSPQKRRIAGMFSVSAAGAAGVREELSGQGVQVAELDQLILSDQQLMTAAANGQLDSTAGAEFAQRHLADLQRVAGGGDLEGELGTKLGAYVGFRALAESLAVQFGREP